MLQLDGATLRGTSRHGAARVVEAGNRRIYVWTSSTKEHQGPIWQQCKYTELALCHEGGYCSMKPHLAPARAREVKEAKCGGQASEKLLKSTAACCPTCWQRSAPHGNVPCENGDADAERGESGGRWLRLCICDGGGRASTGDS